MEASPSNSYLDLLLLSVISARPGHGYAIIEELRNRSDGTFDLPEGTVYPALHRLERDGLLASRWDASTGRKRRLYTVTRRGRAVLERRREQWAGFSYAISTVVEGAR